MTAKEWGNFGDLALTVVIGVGLTIVGFLKVKPKPPKLFHGADAANKARRALRWVGPLIVVFGVARCFETRSSDSQPSVKSWITFHSSGGRFSVAFPESVLEETSNQPMPGTTSTVTTHCAKFTDQERDILFSASYQEPKPDLIMPTIETLVAALTQQLGAPLSDHSVSVGGIEGRELVFHKENYTDTVRYFMNDRRLIWIQAVAPDRYASVPDISTYLSSFHSEVAGH